LIKAFNDVISRLLTVAKVYLNLFGVLKLENYMDWLNEVGRPLLYSWVGTLQGNNIINIMLLITRLIKAYNTIYVHIETLSLAKLV